MSRPRHNKLRIPYNPKPFVVDEKKGTMVKRSDGTETVTRCSSLKVIPKHFAQSQENGVRTPEMRQSPVIHPNLVPCRQVTAGARNVRVAFVNFKKVDIYKTVLLERRSQVNIYQRDFTIELLNSDHFVT